MVQSLIKTMEDNYMIRSHHRRPVHDAITPRHPPILAPSRVGVLRATHHMHYMETTFIKQG
jgi:hypothetical protein